MKFVKIKKGEKIPPFSQFIKETREQDGGETVEGSHGREYFSPNYSDFIYLLVPEDKDFEYLRKRLGIINASRNVHSRRSSKRLAPKEAT